MSDLLFFLLLLVAIGVVSRVIGDHFNERLDKIEELLRAIESKEGR